MICWSNLFAACWERCGPREWAVDRGINQGMHYGMHRGMDQCGRGVSQGSGRGNGYGWLRLCSGLRLRLGSGLRLGSVWWSVFWFVRLTIGLAARSVVN